MCTGGAADEEMKYDEDMKTEDQAEEKGEADEANADAEEAGDDKVVVVPVIGDADAEHHCCAYEGSDGSKKYAVSEGPSDCNDRFGEMKGAWHTGVECMPCCCKAEGAEGADATYELTTPTSCTAVGECVAAEDAGACLAMAGEMAKDAVKKAIAPRKVPQSGARRPGSTKPSTGSSKPSTGSSKPSSGARRPSGK